MIEWMFVYETFRTLSPPTQLFGTQITDNSLTTADVVYSLDNAYKFEGGIKAALRSSERSRRCVFVSDSVNLYGTLMKNVS